MKKIVALSVLFCLVVFSAGAQVPDLAKLDIVERSVPAGPVALVNGVAVEGRYFLEEYRRHLRNVMSLVADQNLTDEFRVHAGLTTLGELLREEILVQEASRRKIQVTSKDIETEYQEKLRAFSQYIEETSGEKVGEAQVLERARQSREEALDSIRRQLLAEKMAEELAKEKKLSVTDGEVKKFYDENPNFFQMPGSMHLNHILVVPKPSAAKADDKAWTKATEQIRHAKSRIEAGEQFAAVARSVSEAPDAEKGGDMGMLPVNLLPPFYVEAGQALKPKELSEPIRSQHGMHLIQLVGTESQHAISFEEARENIRAQLKASKMEEIVLEFCEPVINDTSKTQIFLQLDRNLAVTNKEATK